VFFLRKPKRKAAVPAEPALLAPDPSPAPTYQPLAIAPFVDDTPDGLPGEPDLYGILGVDPLASDDVIRYTYRRRAAGLHERRWRPSQAVRHLAELNAAYEILGKPDRRADYDRRRVRRAFVQPNLNGSARMTTGHGRGLPSGQRHERRRLRVGRAGGLVEIVAILTVIALAWYVAATLMSAPALVDLSKVVEIGDSLGLTTRRRGPTPTPATAPTPVGSLPAGLHPGAARLDPSGEPRLVTDAGGDSHSALVLSAP